MPRGSIHKPGYAGLDGGGTRTTCVVYDARTGAVGHGKAGPLNINYVPVTAARQAVRSAVTDACAAAGILPQDLCVAGVAAPWTEEIVVDVLAALGADVCRTEVWGEDACALTATLCQPIGLVLIAGTGSRCAYLAAEAGAATVIAGAWGSLFGDEGSGYAIGAAALRAVTQAWDGRGPATALAEAVAGHWRLTGQKDLVRVVYGAPTGAWRYRIASLCPLVGNAATGGDWVAQEIIRNAARDLSLMVVSVVQRAKLAGRIKVVTAGGVFGLGLQITVPLWEALRNDGIDAELVPERLPPAYGALLLALPEEPAIRPDQAIITRLVAYHAAHAGSSDDGTQPSLMYNGPKKPEEKGAGGRD